MTARSIVLVAVTAAAVASPRAQRTPAPAPHAELAGIWQVVFPDTAAQRIDTYLASTSPGDSGAGGDAEYYNASVKPSVLIVAVPALKLTLSAKNITLRRAGESVTYDTSGKPQSVTVDTLRVTTTTHWDGASLMQEITGDHHLRMTQVFAPSADGMTLTMTTTVESPGFRTRLVLSRTYVRPAHDAVVKDAPRPTPGRPARL